MIDLPVLGCFFVVLVLVLFSFLFWLGFVLFFSLSGGRSFFSRRNDDSACRETVDWSSRDEDFYQSDQSRWV